MPTYRAKAGIYATALHRPKRSAAGPDPIAILGVVHDGTAGISVAPLIRTTRRTFPLGKKPLPQGKAWRIIVI